MTTKPIPAPDWFDTFWEKHEKDIPIFFRNARGKELARSAMDAAIQGAAQAATTPQGLRALIAFSRISAIVKGVHGVCDAPDPSPEEVAAAVEKLAQRAITR